MSSKDMNKDSLEEGELETIFSLAVPREKPPEFLEQRVWQAVHSEWRRNAAPAVSRFGRVYFAAAAVMVLAVAALLLLQLPGQHSIIYESAQIARVTGPSVLVRGGKRSAVEARARMPIRNGDELVTGNGGGIALLLENGQQLRLGENSRAHFGPAGKIRLAAGRIYVNSGEESVTASAITVITALGQVRHLGTRFQVLIEPAQLRVDVRDGKVAVKSETGSDTIALAGQSLSIVRGGDASVSKTGVFGEQWQWVDVLVPPLSIDGKNLHEVIVWAARESGRELVFADTRLENETRNTTLHGALVLDEPLQGLTKVMLTTRMQFVLRDDQIYISPKL